MDEDVRKAGGGVCPECGLGLSVRGVARPWWVRWAWVFQVVVLVGAVGVLVWVNWPRAGDWVEWKRSRDVPGAVRFPAERVGWDDIGAYARGERHDGRLMRALTEESWVSQEWIRCDNMLLFVDFVKPKGDVTRYTRIGWPKRWLIHDWEHSGEDVYAVPGALDRTLVNDSSSWRGFQHHRSRRVGASSEKRIIDVGAIGFTALVSLAVGLAMIPRGWWVAIRGERKVAWRGWRPAMILVVIVSAMCLVLGWSEVVHSPTTATQAGGMRFEIGELRELRGDAGGEAELAQRIIASQRADPPASHVLAFSWSIQRDWSAAYWTNRWPLDVVKYSKLRQDGFQGGEARLRWRYRQGQFGVISARGSGAEARSVLQVWVGGAALLVVYAWWIWVVVGVLVKGRYWWRAARARRRAREGRCVGCGYELVGLG